MKQKSIRKAVRLILTTELSSREIGLQSGFHHSTIQRYRVILNSKGGGLEELNQLNDQELTALFLKSRGKTKKKRCPNWQYVYNQLGHKGVTLMLLWHDYVLDDPETAYSYTQFAALYRLYRSKVDVTMRQTHYAGEECYIDFTGKLIPYYNAETKKEYFAQVFVSVLGCSDMIFARACRSQQLPDWIECHIHMFDFYGGVPAVLIPDNLRSAVSKSGKIPEINRTYEDLGEHYGCNIYPARPLRPQDKSKAELAVKLVTRWIIARVRHRQFFSIEEINSAISDLLKQLNNRPFKRLPGCRRTRFEELDRPVLRPLPDKPFAYGEWSNKLKVGPDYHVYIKNHAYSVPYKLVAQKVEARLTAAEVEVFHLGKRVAIHKRSDEPGGHTTNPTHRPVQHAVYAQQQLDDFLIWAASIGKAATEVVKAQFHGKPAYSTAGAKACDQLKHLCRLHGSNRFESACRHSAKLQSMTVKTVRATLQSGVDQLEQDSTLTGAPMPRHSNLRGVEYFTGGAV